MPGLDRTTHAASPDLATGPHPVPRRSALPAQSRSRDRGRAPATRQSICTRACRPHSGATPRRRVHNVSIINDVTALALRYGPSTPQRHHRSCAKEALEPVIVEMHAQAMANEPRRRRVEDAAQDEAAARRDGDDLLLVISRPALG